MNKTHHKKLASASRRGLHQGLLLLLAISLTACTLQNPTSPLPTSSQTVQTETEDAATASSSSFTPTTTPQPTASPQATVAPQATPTPQATVTPVPTPQATPASPALDDLDNQPTGWYYVPATPAGSQRPATVPDAVNSLMRQTGSLWQEENPSGKPLYLTMDEGYEYQDLTSRILDIAQRKALPITFFVTGSYIDRNPQLVQRMVSGGHLVANHTQTHPNLPQLLEAHGPAAVLAELETVEQRFQTLTGQPMNRYIRPPEGSYSQRLLTLFQQSGYQAVFWSFAYRDWLTDEQPDQGEALEKILSQLHPGSILLLHAVSSTNVAVLEAFVDQAREAGYTFKLLTEWP